MSTTEYKDPESLEDELWNVHERTRTNGNIGAEVTEYTRAGASQIRARQMVIKYKLPNGTTGNEKFPIPEVDSDQFEIVRLLNGYGYSLAQIEEFPGTEIEMAYNDGDYEMVIPEPEVSRRERLDQWFKRVNEGIIIIGAFCMMPLTALWLIYTEIESDDADWGIVIPVVIAGMVAWGCLASLTAIGASMVF